MTENSPMIKALGAKIGHFNDAEVSGVLIITFMEFCARNGIENIHEVVDSLLALHEASGNTFESIIERLTE